MIKVYIDIPAFLAILLSTCLAYCFSDVPENKWLANSMWPISHQSPYAQASTSNAGPLNAEKLAAPQFVQADFINITLAESPKYRSGHQIYWGSSLSSVYKVAIVDGHLRMLASLPKPENSLRNISTPTSGAYTLVDFENTFYTVQGQNLLAYRDRMPDFISSPIQLVRRLNLNNSILKENDAIVGLSILWDGNLVFVTKNAKLGVVSRDFSKTNFIDLADGQEQVSNSLATDETGGIYVVTSKAMYRAHWNGIQLSLDEHLGAWRVEYNAGSEEAGSGRLGAGSGSTPTIMGSTNGQKFVVITDGAKVANLILFWAEKIPSDWQAIAPGIDRRVAGIAPVNFGDTLRSATQSEQSVLVSEYGAILVSNDYRNRQTIPSISIFPIVNQLLNGLTILNSGQPKHQPFGVHKFDWNPSTRKLTTSWVRTDISCPNAIPSMSRSSNRFYCVGAYQGSWTIESLNWSSGQNHFRKVIGSGIQWNSFYSATQITDGGGIIYGSLNGIVYLPPK